MLSGAWAQSTQAVQQSFTRLSSGLRINKASDDAAGLAISESLNVDARVYTQGIRNLNDGISLTNIADGAIESLSNIVIRQEELAEQAANGTLGSKQRSVLDAEAAALSQEFFRIARTAEFNGQQLLDGTIGDVMLQAGYGESGGILVGGFGGAMGTGGFGCACHFFYRHCAHLPNPRRPEWRRSARHGYGGSSQQLRFSDARKWRWKLSCPCLLCFWHYSLLRNPWRSKSRRGAGLGYGGLGNQPGFSDAWKWRWKFSGSGFLYYRLQAHLRNPRRPKW